MEPSLGARSRVSRPDGTWVVTPRPDPHARVRLVCFPHAGAGVASLTWTASRLPSVEVLLVRLPGRESRLLEPPYRHLSDLLPVLVSVLTPHIQADVSRPFALFGHSIGALIAFELARSLRATGLPEPSHLFVSGLPAPHLPAPADSRPIHDLPGDQLVEQLRSYAGTPPALLDNPELMHLILPTLRADFAISETYVYQPAEPLGCGISAFGALHDPDTPEESIARWSDLTIGPFRGRILPGNHFFLQDGPGRDELAACLLADLDRVSG